MPLPLVPLVLGGAAVATTLFGVKKGYDGYCDTKDAGELHERAKSIYGEVSEKLEKRKQKTQKAFEKLGEQKAKIVQRTFENFKRLITKLDIDYEKNLGVALKGFNLEAIREIQHDIVNLQTAVGGLVGGGVAGAMAGFGAYGAAGALATASTGTAISSLSGAAAANATLAWFGGGAISAGGLGMAGGTYVLGGIVAAPVIAVAASVFAASAEKRKYDAKSYYESILAVCESLNNERLIWKAVAKKTEEIAHNIAFLDNTLIAQMQVVETILNTKGANVSTWGETEQYAVKNMINTAETLKNVIEAPVLSDNDENTRAIIELQKYTKDLMGEIQKKWGDKK